MTERGTTGAGESQIIGIPRVHHPEAGWTWHYWEMFTLVKPRFAKGNRPLTPLTVIHHHGDGRGEMIPTFDGTDVRQFERRVRLFVSNTRMATERRARKLLERLEARAFDSFEGTQDLETPNGVENLLDHLRTHFEPIQPQRRHDRIWPVDRIWPEFVF